LNVCTRFARNFVKNESEHFVDCRRKILLFADYRGRAKISFAGQSHMLMYDKTCGEDRNDAVQDLEVEGPYLSNRNVGKQRFGMKMNEGRLISRLTVKTWQLQRN